MRYAIFHEDSLTKAIASLVFREVERFDVRAEIVEFGLKDLKLKSRLREFKADLVFIIGSNKSRPIARLLLSRDIKVCFLYQSTSASEEPQELISQMTFFHSDLPTGRKTSDFEVKGSLLFEYIRKQRLSQVETNSKPVVGVVQKESKRSGWQVEMIKKLSLEMPEVDFNHIQMDANLNESIAQVLKSNVVVSTDWLSSMLAVCTNSPSLNTYTKKLFKKSSKTPLSNSLLDEDIIHSIYWKEIEEVKHSLGRLLHDHQYSADILYNYQRVKSLIGESDVSRSIVQEVIESLDQD